MRWPTVAPDPAFGQVLLEQKTKAGSIGNAIFLMVLGLPMMLVVFAREAPTQAKVSLFFLGAVIVAFALIMLWRHWMHVFLQERGIREYRQRRARSLAYDQVDEIIFSSLRIFMHGSYIHTLEKLALKADRMSGPPLVCTHIFKEANPRAPDVAHTPILHVRNVISMALAERFSQELARKNSLPWTPELRINSAGLEIVGGESSGQAFEWRRVSRMEIDQGKLQVWVDADPRPRVATLTSAVNFYPLYLLAMKLCK